MIEIILFYNIKWNIVSRYRILLVLLLMIISKSFLIITGDFASNVCIFYSAAYTYKLLKKTCFRFTMVDDRLNGSAMIEIEHDMNWQND